MHKPLTDQDFVAQDKIISGDEVHGDKVGGNKISVGDVSGSGPANIAGGDIHIHNPEQPAAPMQQAPAKNKFAAGKLLGLLVSLAAIVGCIAAVLVVPEFRQAFGLDGEDFPYLVHVQREGTGEIIKDAKVIVEVVGNAPLVGYTDSNGYARIQIAAGYAGKPGRLRVEMTGYEPYRMEMDINKDLLPNTIYLVPLP